ncbi:MAG: glycosyltransferase family 4 protein [Planctomycetes bacterium]|nr:glycosyltransferase family 4 protein [Planctomycetota bacterium]
MRQVLHLFANHKITGPAELALETARAQQTLGLPVRFVSANPRKTRYRDAWLQILARERGLAEVEIPGLRLPKHIGPLRSFLDVRSLAGFLREGEVDLIHCHLAGDHYVARLAIERSGRPIPLVRTVYDGEAPPPTGRRRAAFASADRLVCHSEAVAGELRARAGDYGLDPTRVSYMPPPIDTVRFDPARDLGSRREVLGVPAEGICFGIVARMQTHRRFEVLLEAFQQAQARDSRLHLVIVGRGTNQEEVARGPVRERGLEESIHFAGYVSGEDYVATLASCDAKVFMVPGSDGTCRAVREALALGLPAIVTARGILPELVRHELDGLVVPGEVCDLRDAFLRLASDRSARDAMGKAARVGAEERFAYPRLAERYEAIYRELCASSS